MKTKSYKTELGDYLYKLKWDYFGTFTTRWPLRREVASELFYSFVKTLQLSYPGCRIAAVAEPFANSKRYHIHAIIKLSNNDPHKPENDLQFITNRWQAISRGRGKQGFNHTLLNVYDPSKKGGYYITKNVDKDEVDFLCHNLKRN